MGGVRKEDEEKKKRWRKRDSCTCQRDERFGDMWREKKIR